MMDKRLFRLRIELWTAAQVLKGEDLDAFWSMIRELAESEEGMRAVEARQEPR